MVTLEQRVRPHPEVPSIRELDTGETVLLQLESTTYYSLNANGTYIWQGLDLHLAGPQGRLPPPGDQPSASGAASLDRLIEGHLSAEIGRHFTISDCLERVVIRREPLHLRRYTQNYSNFTNTSSSTIINPLFEAIKLEGGKILLNADSGVRCGGGANLTASVGADGSIVTKRTFIIVFFKRSSNA